MFEYVIAVRDVEGLTLAQKCVLHDLASRIKDGRCFPSLETIAIKTGANIKTVIKAIKHLEEIGFITVQRSSKTSNTYTLNLLPIQGADTKIGSRYQNREQPTTKIGHSLLPKQGIEDTIEDTIEDIYKKKVYKKENKTDKQPKEKRRKTNPLPITEKGFYDRAKEVNETREQNKRLPADMLEEFCSYWTEPDQFGKMRFQKQTTFEIERRMATWRGRSFNNNNGNQRQKKPQYTHAGYLQAPKDSRLRTLF